MKNGMGMIKEKLSSLIGVRWNITNGDFEFNNISTKEDLNSDIKGIMKLLQLIEKDVFLKIKYSKIGKEINISGNLDICILELKYEINGLKEKISNLEIFNGNIIFKNNNIIKNLEIIEILKEFSNDTFIKIDNIEKNVTLIGNFAKQISESFEYSFSLDEFIDCIKTKEGFIENYNSIREGSVLKEEIIFYNQKDYYLNISLKKKEDLLIGIIKDKTEEVIKREELKKLLSHDNITGFKTKEEIVRLINKRLVCANGRCSLILLDLDDFKFINESFGYQAGDFVLREVGLRLTKKMLSNEYICRHNGDEFIIFFENVDSKEYLEECLNNIMDIFDYPIVYRGKHLYINGSIGVSVSPHNGLEFYGLLKNADAALTIAKKTGKGNFAFFDYSISKEFSRTYDIQRCLRTAIKKEEFYVLFQPKVFVSNRKVIGFEALLRWNSSELGQVSPGELIPIAEMTRLIIPISTFILEEVFKKIRELLNLGYDNFKIAINLSELQLRYNTILRDLQEFREKYDVDLKYIEIEITESILMKSFDKNIKILKDIKKLGATIALDDFGTGYSSLNYLTKLPIDVLKIDRSFVTDLNQNLKSRCIVENIINLSHQLGIDVVAEGVEEKEQVDYLKNILCDIIQGYYFSKPREFKDIVKMIGKKI
ncbi:diguanylate cyclase (GGDEF) domain-containing protein [Clostridium thermobutyricum]|uniref:Diguanylate cyclase (GGDEF) domain-containing protein n=1 Tax=Clostridium thermobutyricum TaxID=29372 RepID=N9WHI0_9CLOT|nr:bifunctional diguanylate cyclase/phosphodiesterase [Clostridium thermobutyricum]ENZ02330.1 diguanylate cyclase (GGDEF) domain-containing protein [Clostridium thermobutyricum]